MDKKCEKEILDYNLTIQQSSGTTSSTAIGFGEFSFQGTYLINTYL